MGRALPLHPSRRHPLTGLPLQAAGILPNGRIVWPILGGDGTVDPAEPSEPSEPSEPAEPTGEPNPASPPPGSGDDYADLRDICEELGLEPGAIAGRLIASKKWEQRAKKGGDPVTEPAAEPTEPTASADPVDPEAVREQVRTEMREQHEADLAETAIRARLGGHGVEGDAIETIVTTLTSGLRGVITEGRVDADKVSTLVSLLAPTAQKWPDMGQGNRGGTTATGGVEAGRSAYERRHGKK